MGQGTKFLARFGREAQDPLSSAPLGELSPTKSNRRLRPCEALSSPEDDEQANFTPNPKT
ncbi:MAG: hypothetical protein IJB34_01990 [Clostridia bacterium]|nr:hypothetical protein [Clostridia bacterium]